MLGSLPEADDAVQDAWLRVSRADASEIDNLGGWLTTIVARVCLNMLRSRNRRREESFEEHLPDPIISPYGELQPEEEALLAVLSEELFERTAPSFSAIMKDFASRLVLRR